MQAREKVKAVFDLIRLNRQYGTLLVMMPTLWSLFLAADGRPPATLIAVFVAGSFLMRSAGCVMNDLADRNFDRFVARTRERPLPSGRLSVREATIILALLLLTAASLLFFLNPLTRRLSLIALLVAALYPFAKRFTPLPQLVLGVAFSWGAVMAWAAVRGKLDVPPLLILLANLCWTVGYDTIYALMDREDDRKAGIGSTALFFGDYAWAAVGLLYLMALFFLAWLGTEAGLGRLYRFVLLLTGGTLGYQTILLSKEPPPLQLFSLFKSNVGVGILVLLGICLDLNL
jgi:4-hydroxybenzoate polyprenyltransferase